MKTATNAAVLADALSLVMAPSPSSAVTAKWSPVQRKVAWDWCGREVLAANDNPVKRREPPEFLARWMIANNGPKPRRIFCVLALAFGIGSAGCATAPRPVEVETVGALSASTTHVYVQPVHADTVLTSSFGAVDTDEDAPVVAAAPVVVETPDVAPKAGLTMGSVR